MRALKKVLAFIVSISMIATFSACNSNEKESSKEETTTEITTEVPTEAATEEFTEMPTEETTEPEATNAEKDETIVNLLKKGFTIENMGIPTINFVPETNTYVVLTPIESASIAAEFMMDNGGEKWDNYVKTFGELVNKAIDLIQTLKSDESINVRTYLIYSIESPAPFICYENGNKIFDRYNVQESEEVIFVLKTLFDLYPPNGLFNLEVRYDSNKDNNYIVCFYTNTVNAFKDDDYCKTFSGISKICEEYIQSYGNPTVTVNILENNTQELICTIENEKYTYNIFD